MEIQSVEIHHSQKPKFNLIFNYHLHDFSFIICCKHWGLKIAFGFQTLDLAFLCVAAELLGYLYCVAILHIKEHGWATLEYQERLTLFAK